MNDFASLHRGAHKGLQLASEGAGALRLLLIGQVAHPAPRYGRCERLPAGSQQHGGRWSIVESEALSLGDDGVLGMRGALAPPPPALKSICLSPSVSLCACVCASSTPRTAPIPIPSPSSTARVPCSDFSLVFYVLRVTCSRALSRGSPPNTPQPQLPVACERMASDLRPLSSYCGAQAALKCSYRSDRVARDCPVAIRVLAAKSEARNGGRTGLCPRSVKNTQTG